MQAAWKPCQAKCSWRESAEGPDRAGDKCKTAIDGPKVHNVQKRQEMMQNSSGMLSSYYVIICYHVSLFMLLNLAFCGAYGFGQEMIAAYTTRVAMRSLWKVQAHKLMQVESRNQGRPGTIVHHRSPCSPIHPPSFWKGSIVSFHIQYISIFHLNLLTYSQDFHRTRLDWCDTRRWPSDQAKLWSLDFEDSLSYYFSKGPAGIFKMFEKRSLWNFNIYI